MVGHFQTVLASEAVFERVYQNASVCSCMVFCCRVLARTSWTVACRIEEMYEKLSSRYLSNTPITLLMPKESAAGGASMRGQDSTADPELEHTEEPDIETP